MKTLIKNVLAWFAWRIAPIKRNYEWNLLSNDEFKGKMPLSLSSTVIPNEYHNHTIEEDKNYYSKTING